MRALTLRQPFAWAVASGLKKVENRSWKPTLQPGEVFAIHAGAARPSPADLAKVVARLRGRVPLPKTFVRGAIIAVAKVRGTVTSSNDLWFTGPVGWLLEDVVELPQPVECKGMLSLWTIPTEIERAVARQLRGR